MVEIVGHLVQFTVVLLNVAGSVLGSIRTI
jgi:hypothetical protein